MAGFINSNDLLKSTAQASQNRAKSLMDQAMSMAGTYVQGLKQLAGGAADKPMKTMAKQQIDDANTQNYYASQGLVAPINSEDPSGAIRLLSQKWAENKDNPDLQNQFHDQAVKLAQGAGWLKPGESTASVISMPQVTNAGLPTWERQAGEVAAESAAQQQDFENQLALAELGRKQSETNYNINKPYYNPNSSNSSDKVSTNTIMSGIAAQQANYKKTSDYKADLIRNQAKIIGLVGMSGYNALITDADKKINDEKNPDPVNRNYIPKKYGDGANETRQPLTYFLSDFSSPTSGSSGSLSSWVSSAMNSAGVGNGWAEPLAWIIQHESSGNPNAINPKSGAYGLMQFLPQTWGNYGYQKTSDPVKQIEAGINYIKARYGTAANAKAFWQKNGWY